MRPPVTSYGTGLSRKGNRQINRVLHIMATVQLRNATDGRAYFDRKKSNGKSSNEAMRCLKRRLSDAVYRTLVDDAVKAKVTGSGGHRDNDSDSSAAGSQPQTSSSDKPHRSPSRTQPKPHSLLRLDTEGSHERALTAVRSLSPVS